MRREMTSGAGRLSSHKKRSRLVSDLMSRRMEEDDADADRDRFFIRSHNEGFQNRQTSVFDKLNELESKFTVNVSAWKSTDDAGAKDDDDDENPAPRSDNPKISSPPEQFKIPIGVAPKRAAIRAGSSSEPAYSANPDGWTKYSLANVTPEFMSEDANTDAAMTFLKSRWKTCNDYEEGGSDPDDEGGSETHQPPRRLEFGKFLMPEYSVGSRGAAASSAAAKKGCQTSTGLKSRSNSTVIGAASSSSSSREKDPQSDAATDKPVKVNCELPKVKLSFLNSGVGAATDSSDKDSLPDDVGDEPGSSKKKQEAEEGNDDKAGSTGCSGVEPVFRAVRKRKRNIRQASVNNDDGDLVDAVSGSIAD